MTMNLDRPVLSDGFATIPRVSPAGRAFVLVREAQPNAYEQGLMDGLQWGTDDVLTALVPLLGDAGVLIDVGANIGVIALAVACDGIPVLGVEMLPANAFKLHMAAHINGITNLSIVQAAASSTDHLVEVGGEHAWATVGSGNQVACAFKIDTLVAPFLDRLGEAPGRHFVMKIDVEGHELDVLKGATSFISKYRPVIIFESIEFAYVTDDQSTKACKRLLEECGYSLYLQRGSILIPRSSGDLQEGLVCDFVAVPSEQLGRLDGLEARPLTAVERARWADEMANGPLDFRRHAVAVIESLRREHEDFGQLTRETIQRLILDGEPEIAGRAQIVAST